jgi:hypothetical protein
MPLTELWLTSQEQLRDKHVQQIIAFAGTGKLLDGSVASSEFRDYLSHVPSSFLVRYADECLTTKFDDNGLALQDVINQVGRRLGFEVTDGRYRGTAGPAIGFDGLWHTSQGHAIVVEVKTTDAYQISLDTIAGYRRALIKSGLASEDQSSILMVVGRKKTDDLEAQIRGSRHAWDVRLISIDSLFRLLSLKESMEDPQIVHKICDILIPQEFTKVDGIIDIVFSAAEDIQQDDGKEVADELEEGDHKPKFVPVKFNEACAYRVQSRLGITLLRKSRATFVSADDGIALVCTVAREQRDKTIPLYWFAFHPYQRAVLENRNEAYIAFGCGSDARILLIPFKDFAAWLDGLWMTERSTGFYWHVHVTVEGDKLLLHRKKGYQNIDVTSYLLPDTAK